MKLALGLILLVGCGGDDASTTIDAPTGGADAPASTDAAVDSPTAAFALTSPTIVEAGAIPLTHVCAQRGGTNTSPELAWTGAPAGTLSFAVVLTDKSNNLVHAVIYDIPANLTGLPADVDKVYAPPDVAGAHQTLGYDNTTRGYLGPCPPNAHTYEFAVHALSAATLPGTTMATTRAAAVTAITANELGSATLTATFTP
jgi:Raf kinase inhibitor-like YbhB/YbcL family protein